MANDKRLIVGLGNPGPEYKDTRHNVGFRVAQMLLHRLDASARREHQALVGWGVHEGTQTGVALPQTYMNRSGHAVQPLCAAYDLDVSDLLVIVDDLHLDVGQLRLRPGGSSGGHNGLADIAAQLGTTDYPRLRIGIGNDYADGAQAEYVLSPFTAQQADTMQEVLIDAANAALLFVRDGMEAAMNRYNS